MKPAHSISLSQYKYKQLECGGQYKYEQLECGGQSNNIQGRQWSGFGDIIIEKKYFNIFITCAVCSCCA